jgi:hypothetical protein
MNALLVKNGQIEKITLADDDMKSSEEISGHIGNFFTSCFHIPGVGPNVGIYGFCDDEGLLHDEPNFNVILDQTLRTVCEPIAGPIVIVGSDENTDELRGLLDVEMEMFSISTIRTILLGSNDILSIPFLLFNRLAI